MSSRVCFSLSLSAMAFRALSLALALALCFAATEGDTLYQLPVSFMRPPVMRVQSSLDEMTETVDSIIIRFRLYLHNGINDFKIVPWNGPFTVFIPSHVPFLSSPDFQGLAEHTVPGLFSASDLLDLAPGSRIETMKTGYCIDVWESRSSIFISGVRIAFPDMFNNGLLIVHYLDGSLSALSRCSATASRSLPILRLTMDTVLNEAIVRLFNRGYGVLALALRVKYGQFMELQNATIFAVTDTLIFSSVQNYAGNIRFHIAPNRYIDKEELFKLPLGSKIETMERDQNLLVTGTGSLNFVGIKTPEVFKNSKIVVHNLFRPFPQPDTPVPVPAPAPPQCVEKGDICAASLV